MRLHDRNVSTEQVPRAMTRSSMSCAKPSTRSASDQGRAPAAYRTQFHSRPPSRLASVRVGFGDDQLGLLPAHVGVLEQLGSERVSQPREPGRVRARGQRNLRLSFPSIGQKRQRPEPSWSAFATRAERRTARAGATGSGSSGMPDARSSNAESRTVARDPAPRAEGERFELPRDGTAPNGFRDRACLA
jgi:hypothetical protein